MNSGLHISTASSASLGAVFTVAAFSSAPTQATPDLSISVDALASDAEPFGTCLTRVLRKRSRWKSPGTDREVFDPYKVVSANQIHEATQKMGERVKG